MKYIVCESPGNFLFKEKDRPVPGDGEVLIDIKRIGICGTDIHAYGGNQAYFSYPRILGHELAAEIVDSNGSHKFKNSDKVVPIPYLHCGNCIACNNGKTNCCKHMRVMGVHVDGGMQETLSVPEEILIPTPHLSFEEMAIVEPLAIAAHAIRIADVQFGQTILVMGCGPIGLALMALAKQQGANVIALDINQQRLEFAKKEIGVDKIVIASSGAVDEVTEYTDTDLCQAVFDATGNKSALESGPQYLSHGGRFVMVGLSKTDLTFNHPAIHAKETTIMCSRNATREDFDHVIDVLSQKKFPTSSYITHQEKFQNMIGIFDEWIKPDSQVIKAMVSFK
ncbi:MAG TPA: zinc-binding alcohol dehydrogenase family protein [Anditalea sp.]|nr:zinc-binding alcohol dehydrogenase family protein [Anditalea sp.]